MKKVLIGIILFVFCFCFVGLIHADTITPPVITGIDYPDATSLKIKYDPKNTNSSYKVLVYNMTTGDLVKQDINTSSYTFTGLETGKIYNFKARIYYIEGTKPHTSAWSDVVSASPKPGDVTIKSLTGGDGKIVFNYSTTDKPAGVEIFIKELNNVLRTSNLTTYTLSGLTNGKTYTVSMRTYYTNGAYGEWSDPRSVTVNAGTAPAGTATLTKLTAASEQVVANYTVTGSPTGVEINVKELGKSFKTTNLTTYTITGLKNGNTYTITVRTYYSSGAVGAWSSPKSIKLPVTNLSFSTNLERYHFSAADIQKQITVSPSSGTFKYSSSDSSIVSVSSSGLMTAKKAGTATITVVRSLDGSTGTKNITVIVPSFKSREDAIKPWFTAMKEQKEWQNIKPAKYNWKKWRKKGGNVAASKYYGTCITFPSASLQRAGLLVSGGFVTAENGKNFSSGLKKQSKAYMNKKPGYIKNIDVNGNIKKLLKQGKLLKGDILQVKTHTFVYMGDAGGGKYYISESGGWYRKNGVKYNKVRLEHKRSEKRVVKWISRVNTYNVYTVAENCSITKSNRYMASTDVTITYSAISGYKIKSVTLDPSSSNPKSISASTSKYTINNLNANHTLKVVCAK